MTHGPIQPLRERNEESAPTDAPARTVWQGLRKWWWVLALVVLLVGLGVYNAFSGTNNRAMDPKNPGPRGAMALATILTEQGVDVIPVTSVDQALRFADGDATLFLVNWHDLDADARAEIANADADIAIAGSPYAALDGLTTAVSSTPMGTTQAVQAECGNPDAVASSRIGDSFGGVSPGPGAPTGLEICFPTSEDSGLYAAWEEDGQRWHYIADASIGSNGLLAKHGHAALMLRVLGAHPTVVWFDYVPTPQGVFDSPSHLPPWGVPLIALGAITALLAAFWQGRRMGRVVIEPLPVVVLPGEAIKGRARLYQKSKAAGHAAAALRAGTVTRLAHRLGLSRHADAATVIDAVASSSGRDRHEVGTILYGPAPASDSALVELNAALAQLEREVHP